MTPRIEIDHVHLRYGPVAALDGVSATLAGGAIYGLLGRNGSGKSSLLSLIAAFRKPWAGEVRIDGEPVFENPRRTHQVCLIRGAGDTVDDGRRVADALGYAAGFRPDWDAATAARLVGRFGLSPRQRIGELSRGQRSALGIVLGLAARAPITMFDESYLGMDVPSRYAFYDELLAEFAAHPRTIILSTHLVEEVSSLFERVLILDRGQLLLDEDAETLRSRGAAITGPAEAVDRFTRGRTVLSAKQLGPTKSALLYGDIDPAQRHAASAAGMEIGPVALQDLYVHLTEPQGGPR